MKICKVLRCSWLVFCVMAWGGLAPGQAWAQKSNPPAPAASKITNAPIATAIVPKSKVVSAPVSSPEPKDTGGSTGTVRDNVPTAVKDNPDTGTKVAADNGLHDGSVDKGSSVRNPSDPTRVAGDTATLPANPADRLNESKIRATGDTPVGPPSAGDEGRTDHGQELLAGGNIRDTFNKAVGSRDPLADPMTAAIGGLVNQAANSQVGKTSVAEGGSTVIATAGAAIAVGVKVAEGAKVASTGASLIAPIAYEAGAITGIGAGTVAASTVIGVGVAAYAITSKIDEATDHALSDNALTSAVFAPAVAVWGVVADNLNDVDTKWETELKDAQNRKAAEDRKAEQEKAATKTPSVVSFDDEPLTVVVGPGSGNNGVKSYDRDDDRSPPTEAEIAFTKELEAQRQRSKPGTGDFDPTRDSTKGAPVSADVAAKIVDSKSKESMVGNPGQDGVSGPAAGRNNLGNTPVFGPGTGSGQGGAIDLQDAIAYTGETRIESPLDANVGPPSGAAVGMDWLTDRTETQTGNTAPAGYSIVNRSQFNVVSVKVDNVERLTLQAILATLPSDPNDFLADIGAAAGNHSVQVTLGPSASQPVITYFLPAVVAASPMKGIDVGMVLLGECLVASPNATISGNNVTASWQTLIVNRDGSRSVNGLDFILNTATGATSWAHWIGNRPNVVASGPVTEPANWALNTTSVILELRRTNGNPYRNIIIDLLPKTLIADDDLTYELQ